MASVFKSLPLLLCLVFSVNSVAEQLKERPPFRLLTEYNPPGGYLDENGNAVGVTVELVRRLQQQLNELGQIELMPWGRALMIARQSPNTALFETVFTKQRASWFKWVGPLKHYTISLYGLKHRVGEPDAQRVFPGKLRACNYRNSASAEEIRTLGFAEGRNLLLTARSGDCLNMLLMDRVDLIAITEDYLNDYARQTRTAGFELVKVLQFSERKTYLTFSPDVSDERISRWQKALEQSYRDGTMRKLYQPVYDESIIRRLEEFARQAQ